MGSMLSATMLRGGASEHARSGGALVGGGPVGGEGFDGLPWATNAEGVAVRGRVCCVIS